MQNDNKKLMPVLICSQPKTIIWLDATLSEEGRQKRIARYLDKKGRLKIDTVKESKLLWEK